MKYLYSIIVVVLATASCKMRHDSDSLTKRTSDTKLFEELFEVFRPYEDIVFAQMDGICEPVEYIDDHGNLHTDTVDYIISKNSKSPFRVHLFHSMKGPKLVENLEYSSEMDECKRAFKYVNRHWLTGEEADDEIDTAFDKLCSCVNQENYPIESYRHLVNMLNFYYADTYNHADFTPVYAVALWHIAKQGLGLAREKKLSGLTDMRTDDNKVGLLFIDSHYNNMYNQSLVLLESSNGLYLDMWSSNNDTISEALNFTKVHRIFDEDKPLYICYNDDNVISFNSVIYKEKGGGWIKIEPVWTESAIESLNTWSKNHDFDSYPNNNDYRILFNPRKKQWDMCYFDGENFQPYNGTKPISIHIDGENISLE